MSVNPMDLLAAWVERAVEASLPSPQTFTFTTASPTGVPHARTVLSTTITAEHIRFHSSTPTSKTLDLAENPNACGVFFWPELGRQAIVHGTARELEPEVSEQAFPTRPRQLQIVALAYEDVYTQAGIDTSQGTAGQSIPSSELPASAEHIAALYAAHEGDGTTTLQRPDSWTTIEFTPHRVDFWQGVGPQLAAHKTRYDLVNGRWGSFDILP